MAFVNKEDNESTVVEKEIERVEEEIQTWIYVCYHARYDRAFIYKKIGALVFKIDILKKRISGS